MRDSESLVKVHMTNVTSACSWVSQADLSIEVRAVEVDLATVLVYNLTSILNTIFEDTKGRRICDLLGNQRDSLRRIQMKLTMNAARLSLYCSAFALRSSRSSPPFGRTFTETTFKPAMTAD